MPTSSTSKGSPSKRLPNDSEPTPQPQKDGLRSERRSNLCPSTSTAQAPVYQRGKTWWLSYYINGKQTWESAKTKDKAEARRILQAKLGQLAEGRYAGPAAERVTFDDLADGLFNDYKANARQSLDIAAQRVRLHLRPFFGHKKAHEITPADVNAYIVHRQDEGSSCPWIFPYKEKRLMRIKRTWVTACKKVGLVGKIPHDFRRTAVRNMVRAGIPERVAMQMTGHKTRSVFDRYHIVSAGDLQEAAKRLDQAFLPPTMTKTMTLAENTSAEPALSPRFS